MAENINKVVILNNIRSNENVGSIFRTADAAGVTKIILVGITPAPLDRFGRENKGLTKASLGAEKFVKWEKAENLKDAINTLQNYSSAHVSECTDIFLLENSSCSAQSASQGIHKHEHSNNFVVVAIEQDKRAIDYRELKNYYLKSLPRRQAGKNYNLALIFGNEVEGLSKEDLKLCDVVAELPMRGAMVRQAHHPRNIKRGKESLNVAVCAGIVLYSLL